MSIERAHHVDISPTPLQPQPLVLTDASRLTLSWPPEQVFPQANQDENPVNVDILLFTLDTDSGQWVEFDTLIASNTANDGTEVVTLPMEISNDVVPIAIQIATSLDPSTRFSNTEALYRKLFLLQQRVGVWSSEYFYMSSDVTGMSGRQLCKDWYDEQPDNLPVSLTVDSLPCAPTLMQAQLPTSRLTEVDLVSMLGEDSLMYRDHWFSTFHEEAVQCFRQTSTNSDLSTEQECCYNDEGFLITGSPNGGAVKRVSKDVNRARHFVEDTRPFLLCCTGQTPNCGQYYGKRPSDDGSRFNPPSPGQCT